MMGKSAFFSEGTAGQMKSAPSFAKDDDSTLPKEPNGSKIGLGPKPIWGMSVDTSGPILRVAWFFSRAEIAGANALNDHEPETRVSETSEPATGAESVYNEPLVVDASH